MSNLAEAVRDRAYYVESCLQNWANWMDSGGTPDGLPQHASGGAQNASSMDWESCEAAYAKLDIWLAENTNAVIDGLVSIQQAALCNAYLASVWRFNRQGPDHLQRAKENLEAGLLRRGVWLGD